MADLSLRTIICGTPAGTLWQDAQGLVHFKYDEGYHGAPLSLALPICNRTYHQQALLPFLFGLLPDSEQQRKAIARDFGISPNNPVTMLDRIGLDCQGGVQFCREERVDDVLARTGEYRPLTDHEIALRLKAIRSDDEATWVGEEESWSLGGNQGKFALGLRDGAWCSCIGSAPTTHIFKNGVVGFKLQALNEFVCMKTAERAGVPTAHVDYRLFEDEPALIIERYDRTIGEDGTILRAHQEDLCQALGVMPFQKYTADGGPAARDVLTLLGTAPAARLNILLFTLMLYFNYLIGGTDAHAKNYSLLLGTEHNVALARMYDVASGFAYDRLRRHGRLAMAIGGENRFGRVGSGALERYAQSGPFEQFGLGVASCRALMMDLAQEIPISLAEIFDEYAAIPGMDELRERLEPPIIENCERTLELL